MQNIFSGSSFSIVRICCFALFYIIVNWISLGLRQLIGQNKTSEDAIFWLWEIISGILRHCADQTINEWWKWSLVADVFNCFFLLILNYFLNPNAQKQVIMDNHVWTNAITFKNYSPDFKESSTHHTDSYNFPFPGATCEPASPAVSLGSNDGENSGPESTETRGQSSTAGTHSAWFIFFAVLDLLIKQLRESDREQEMKRRRKKKQMEYELRRVHSQEGESVQVMWLEIMWWLWCFH